MRGRRVRSIARAGAFVQDVGFALLFPSERVLVPSLWEAVAGEDAVPFAGGMDAAERRVWGWKDELPLRGLAWYGNFIAGRGSFLSPSLLRWLYPGDGGTDDHRGFALSPAAHQIATVLGAGPQPSARLRAVIADRSRYQRGVLELQRHLLVTTAGVHQQASGWPSTVLDLTCRRFEVGAGGDQRAAAELFIDVVLAASVRDLARTFRWPVGEARGHLDALTAAARVTRSGTRYLAPAVAAQFR